MKDIIRETVTTKVTEVNDAVEYFLKYFKEASFALLILGTGYALREAVKKGYTVNIGIGEFSVSVVGTTALMSEAEATTQKINTGGHSIAKHTHRRTNNTTRREG